LAGTGAKKSQGGECISYAGTNQFKFTGIISASMEAPRCYLMAKLGIEKEFY